MIPFTSRRPKPYDVNVLAPEQQRRVIEYGSGRAADEPWPGRKSANAAAPEGLAAWIDRALELVEPVPARVESEPPAAA